MKKLLFVLCLLFALPVSASTVSDGAIVKTDPSPDVYIVKYSGGKMYKRLVLNEKVFSSYQHLKWENVITIPESEMKTYTTSDLVKVDGYSEIYQLKPNGDIGDRYTLLSTKGYDLNSVYIINDVDFNNYTYKGTIGDKAGSDIEETGDTVDNTEDNTDTTNTREEEMSAVLLEIDSNVSKMNIKITEYETKIESLKSDIAKINLPGVTSLSTKDKIRKMGEECAKLEEEYTPLKEKRDRLVTIRYEIDDYVTDGTKVPAEDRAYLNSLGISW